MKNINYKFECYKNKLCPEWDKAVADSYGNVFMTSAWGLYESRLKYRPGESYILLIRNNDTIVAGILILIHQFRFLGRIGASYGIVYSNEQFPDALNALTAEIKQFAANQKLSFTGISLEKESYKEIEPNLKAAGFYINPPKFPLSQEYDATLILDLTLSVDEIFARMKRERRNRIKKGLKSPVEFRVGTRDDIPLFFDLYSITLKKYGAKVKHTLESLYRMWDELAPHGWIVIHLGVVEDKVICASLGYSFGKIYQNWLWGWNGEYSQYNISDVVDWNSIVWAKENGFTLYDFVYVVGECADAILSPDPVPESIKANILFGPAYYKLQFGGSLDRFAKPHCYYPTKLKYLLFHVILNKLTVRMNVRLDELILNVSKFLRRN